MQATSKLREKDREQLTRQLNEAQAAVVIGEARLAANDAQLTATTAQHIENIEAVSMKHAEDMARVNSKNAVDLLQMQAASHSEWKTEIERLLKQHQTTCEEKDIMTNSLMKMTAEQDLLRSQCAEHSASAHSEKELRFAAESKLSEVNNELAVAMESKLTVKDQELEAVLAELDAARITVDYSSSLQQQVPLCSLSFTLRCVHALLC